MTVDVGNQLGGSAVDGFKTCTKLFQLLVFRPRCDIAKAIFACFNTIIGTNGKRYTFCLDFLGMAVFSLFIEETVCGDLTADKVQPFVLGECKATIFAKVKGLGCDDRTGVIDYNVVFDRYRHTGIVVRTSQIIAIHSFGNISRGNTPIRKQGGYIEDFNLLVFRSIFRFLDFLLIVELGVSNLVNNGRYGLHLAHALTDSNFLIVQREIPIRAITDRDDFNGNGRSSAQSFHKNLVVLHVTSQIGCELRQRFSVRLRHVKHRYGLEHRDFDFLFLDDNLTVCIKHRQVRVGVSFLLFDFLLEGCGSNDLDAFFALHYVALKLVSPLVEASHQSGVGLLHIDEHGIVYAVLVEAAHRAEILSVLV